MTLEAQICGYAVSGSMMDDECHCPDYTLSEWATQAVFNRTYKRRPVVRW